MDSLAREHAPRLFVEAKHRVKFKSYRFEDILAASKFRLRSKANHYVPCVDDDLQARFSSLKHFEDGQLLVQSQDLVEKSTHSNVGYYATPADNLSENKLMIFYFLLTPNAFLDSSSKVVVVSREFTRRTSRSRFFPEQGLLFHDKDNRRPVQWNLCNTSRSDPAVYVSWPEMNPHSKKAWHMHRPGVADEDTRSCDHELVLRWERAPNDLLDFAGFFDNAKGVKSLVYGAGLSALDSQPSSTGTALSETELVIVLVFASLWAAAVVVVVIVLFVKLKRQQIG